MTGTLVGGKLPRHGDFIARGVDAPQRQAIDAWLTAGITNAREQFGDRFDEAFDCAPPWRFAWRDERWTAGALVPSVDSAGRRFPLLVARNGLEEEQVTAAARQCEEAAAEAISNSWTADKLMSTLESGELADGICGCSQGWWNEELGDSGKLEERLPATILTHMLNAVVAQ